MSRHLLLYKYLQMELGFLTCLGQVLILPRVWAHYFPFREVSELLPRTFLLSEISVMERSLRMGLESAQ